MPEYHEGSKVPMSDEWYTPPEIFHAFDKAHRLVHGEPLMFDLDPFSPGEGKGFVPARKCLTVREDGFTSPWVGSVWFNPPFGKRNSHVPALNKFINHNNGLGLLRAYTSSGWFHEHLIKLPGMCFPKGKTKFVREDGTVGKAPGSGIVLFAAGQKWHRILKHASQEIGWWVDNS